MIEYFKRTIKDTFLRKISELETGSWINVVNPSLEEIRFLVKNFGLDRENLGSGLNQNELPRIDLVEDNIYIFAKIVPIIRKRKIETYLMVITPKFILTLSKTKPNFIEQILQGKVEFVTTQKLKCLIKLFSLMNINSERLTRNVVKRIQTKRKLIAELREKDVNALLDQENLINNLVSSYYHMNILYDRITKKLKFFEQDKEILEDLIIEAKEGFNLCKSSLKTISNIRDYYVVLLSNRLNRIITILTLFTIIITLPSIISGLYGMNVLLPFQDNPFVFYFLLLLIGAMYGVFIYYLKKKKII